MQEVEFIVCNIPMSIDEMKNVVIMPQITAECMPHFSFHTAFYM